MKLLLDQNLSWKLVEQLESLFPGTTHIKTALTTQTTDKDIWTYARSNGFVIVTKDDDFEQRSILLGHPPKVIWIRLGNCRTRDVYQIIQRSAKIIGKFENDIEKSYLALP